MRQVAVELLKLTGLLACHGNKKGRESDYLRLLGEIVTPRFDMCLTSKFLVACDIWDVDMFPLYATVLVDLFNGM